MPDQPPGEKMIKISRLLLLAIPLFAVFSGCRPDMEDYEIRGILSVDLRQWGNRNLEVADVQTKNIQEIHPGRKMIRLRYGAGKEIMMDIMDSSRVRLATIRVPTNSFDEKTQSFQARSSEIHQNFGVIGHRIEIPVQAEHVNMRSQACRVSTCGVRPLAGTETAHTISCDGFYGELWDVYDSRYSYEVIFLNEGSGKPMATFNAAGEIRTRSKIVTAKQCQARVEKWQHRSEESL
jgi:hypothetical protein